MPGLDLRGILGGRDRRMPADPDRVRRARSRRRDDETGADMAGGSLAAYLAVAASVLVLCLAACSAPDRDRTVDLRGQHWAATPGVTGGEDGLHVRATDRRIVQQDGSGGQPNPPLQLYGTHLEVDGDFSVTATIADATGTASLSLYDRPPVVADEFRIEPAAVRLTLRGRELQITVVAPPTSPRCAAQDDALRRRWMKG